MVNTIFKTYTAWNNKIDNIEAVCLKPDNIDNIIDYMGDDALRIASDDKQSLFYVMYVRTMENSTEKWFAIGIDNWLCRDKHTGQYTWIGNTAFRQIYQV